MIVVRRDTRFFGFFFWLKQEAFEAECRLCGADYSADCLVVSTTTHTTFDSDTSGLSCSVMFFSSFHANDTYFVWLPRATISLSLLMNFTEVYASVLPTAMQCVQYASRLAIEVLTSITNYFTTNCVTYPPTRVEIGHTDVC